MRIFIIHNFYQHQGGEDVVFNNEIELLSTTNEVKTYTVKNLKGLKGVRQFTSYFWNFRTAQTIVNEIIKFRPDVVHLHNIHYAIGPYLIRKIKKAGFPLVMTLHNYRLICPSATLFHKGNLFTASINQCFPWQAVRLKVLDGSFLKTLYTSFTYYFHRKIGTFNLVNQYLVLSQFAKDIFLRSQLGLPAEKFTVKPNFVPEPQAVKTIEGKHFIYIGRLSEEKGIIPLMKSLAGTNFSLKIFGTGPQQEEVISIANQFTNLAYHGYLPHQELLGQLANAEALILPSICYEGMPMTILDAFALGIPVIASNIGILAEMVVPLYTGDLYNPFDESSIGNKLSTWQQLDDDLKQQIKQNCKNEFIYKYSADINKSLLENIYNQVIK